MNLLPCPFCHSNQVVCHNRYDGWVVQCASCRAIMVHLINRANAVATWNNRPAGAVTLDWLNHHLKIKNKVCP